MSFSRRSGEKEGVIAWSAPQPWHPEAGEFCRNALNHMFGFFSDGPNKGQPKPWNFHHIDQRVARVAAGELSAVIGRHHKDPKRLPGWAYT